MTVETTSFLSGAKITSNGSEKSAKFIKNHKNLIILLLAIILLLFCVSASILQVTVARSNLRAANLFRFSCEFHKTVEMAFLLA